VKDWIPTVISIAAFLFALVNFLVTLIRDRRRLFLSMHERLIDPDLQRGRRLLVNEVHSVEDVQVVRERSEDDYQLMNRALAMFDIFGMYVRRRYISRKLAFEEWGHTFAKVAEHGQYFIDHRAQSQGWQSWPNLRQVGSEARSWVASVKNDSRWAKTPAA
jgi:hypothetical protein